MTDKYILKGKTVVRCEDLFEWGRWIEQIDSRRVASTVKGDVRVRTVFLGLDHSFGEGPPLLFETMIFGGKHDKYQERCSTWEEAEAMHKRACELIRKAK